MEEPKKLKISLKTALLIFLIIIIILFGLIKIIYNHFYERTKENYKAEYYEFEGDFNGDGEKETLKIEFIKWTEEVPADIVDDTGRRSKSTIFLDNKKIKNSNIGYRYIEILDFDNDGIDEIKTIYTAMPPGYGTWCHIYKVINNHLEEVDSYRLQQFIYHTNGFVELSYRIMGNGSRDYYETISRGRKIEIQYRGNKCKILNNSEIIYEFKIDNEYVKEGFIYDFDDDNNDELLIKNKNKILKIQNNEIKIYNDEEFFCNIDNATLNIFKANCDLNEDNTNDTVIIRQAIKNKENNTKELIYTNLYINNTEPKSINLYSIVSNYEILSIETGKLKNRNIIIVNRKNIYTGEIDKEGIVLDQDGTAIGVKAKSLNN